MSTPKQAWKDLYREARLQIAHASTDTHHIYFCGALVTVQKYGKELLIARRATNATRASVARDHFHHILNTIWNKRAPRDKWDRVMLQEDREYSEHWGFKLP